ncbi:S8 family peptidase [Dyella sp. 2RAB6]|uniref:S8 family peptidase n=1 Tax=Dyella sp. 2RAB6 TaxID=3232992 RepID=UPI003F9254C3
MQKPAPLALALALSVALSGSAFAQEQLQGNNAPSGLSAQARSSGTNAKLDNALLRLKQQAAAPATLGSSALPASSSTSRGARSARSVAPENYVTVDIVAKGNVATPRAQLEQLGFRTDAVYRNDIGGRLPVSQIDQAATLPGVITISVPEKRTRSGNVNSQGDAAQRSKALRDVALVRPATPQEPNPPHVDGTGLTIGVISDSFNCLAGKDDDIDSDDLPADTTVVKEASDCVNAGTDEGRAMAQIIHDVAPGASIAFYSPDTMADFAQGIKTLALPADKVDANGRHGGGAQIIVDDLSFFAEPLYQEGIVGAAIDDVATTYGTAYFTAAGNDANSGHAAYDNNAAAFAAAAVKRAAGAKSDPLNLGERLFNFDASGASTLNNLPFTIAAGSRQHPNTTRVAVYWDQPMTPPNATSSLNLCVGDANGKPLAVNLCTGPSVIGQPAHAILSVTNSGAAINGSLRLGLAGGAAPGRVHLIVIGGGSTINRYGTDTGTIYGHPLSPNAQAVGAADYFKTPHCNAGLRTATLESYSSFGGTPLLFDNNGAALAQVAVPQKPDIVAPDGVTTNFFGMASLDAGAANSLIADCRTYPDFLAFQFYGTSAAAPHAAAVAALLWQAQPTATKTQLYSALQGSALDMGAAGFDYHSGYGFIQADQALARLRTNLQKAVANKKKP